MNPPNHLSNAMKKIICILIAIFCVCHAQQQAEKKPEPKKFPEEVLLTPPVVTDNLFEIIVKYLADGIVEKPTFSMEHSVSPQFKCSCTKENMIAAAASLSKAELDEAFKKDGELRITCQFCNTTHVIKPEDMPEQK